MCTRLAGYRCFRVTGSSRPPSMVARTQPATRTGSAVGGESTRMPTSPSQPETGALFSTLIRVTVHRPCRGQAAAPARAARPRRAGVGRQRPRRRPPGDREEPPLTDRPAPSRPEEASSTGSPDRLLTAVEAADLLNMTEEWVREKTRRGELPYVELGRYRRYRRDALLAFIDACSFWPKPRPRTDGR